MKLKEKVSALIEYLNRPERNGKTYNPNERVLIKEVLFKYVFLNWETMHNHDRGDKMIEIDLLLTNWERCGFDRSLNEIFSGEIGKICCDDSSELLEEDGLIICKACRRIEVGVEVGEEPLVQFKNKDAQYLFNLLWYLFEKEITTNN